MDIPKDIAKGAETESLVSAQVIARLSLDFDSDFGNIFQSKNKESEVYSSFIGRTCDLSVSFTFVIIILQPSQGFFLG